MQLSIAGFFSREVIRIKKLNPVQLDLVIFMEGFGESRKAYERGPMLLLVIEGLMQTRLNRHHGDAVSLLNTDDHVAAGSRSRLLCIEQAWYDCWDFWPKPLL